jgi:hypothetical protein
MRHVEFLEEAVRSELTGRRDPEVLDTLLRQLDEANRVLNGVPTPTKDGSTGGRDVKGSPEYKTCDQSMLDAQDAKENQREQGYEQKYEQQQEQERICAQSIGMARDIAVDRLDAISSVGDASREADVVLKIGWCPDMGGRAVVSVRKAVGAGFGYLAEGMPVIRADTAGLVQEATLRVADVHVPVKEAPVVVVDAALSMVVKISERCEAVPACMESMGLLIEVIQMVLSPAVRGAVVDRYILALAVLGHCWLVWRWRSWFLDPIRRCRTISLVLGVIHRCRAAAEVGIACTGLSLMAGVGCAKQPEPACPAGQW